MFAAAAAMIRRPAAGGRAAGKRHLVDIAVGDQVLASRPIGRHDADQPVGETHFC